ncbi:MAG: phosphopantetheine-binding protein [Ignavibacteriaceae bacterium]|nr:phosphopantetheine-binding protein [Ignavibacteriaceae bacterium]
MMDIEKFIDDFESVIEDVKKGSVTPDTNLKKEIETWDSLAVLSVLAMIDSEYEKIISGEELLNCKTVKDIYDLVVSKG